MIKNIALFLSAVGLFAASADARPIKCRFRSATKCTDSVYFHKQLKDGCAVQGTRCRRRFCKANCIDAEKNVVHLCKRGCLDTQTLNSLSKREREGLYKTVLGIGSNPSQKELSRALKREKALFDYRAKRSRGWFSWLRTQPSTSENLESLVFEGKLREQYELLIRAKNNKGNQRATALALRAAAAELVPDPQEFRRKKLSEKVIKKWRAHIAEKRAQTVKELAERTGVSATVAEKAATQAKADAVKGAKPKVPVKPASLRRASQAHKAALQQTAASTPDAPLPPGGDYAFTHSGKGRRSSADSGVSSGRSTPTPEGVIPPPAPPLPPAGWSSKGAKPATPVGTTPTRLSSADTIPPAATVRKQPGDLLAELNQDNQKRLRSAKDRKLADKKPSRRGLAEALSARIDEADAEKIRARRAGIEGSDEASESSGWSEEE